MGSTKRIVFKNSEGGISFITPCEDREYPIEKLLANMLDQKQIPEGVICRIMDITDFPLDGTLNEDGVPNIDKTFRDAWELADD